MEEAIASGMETLFASVGAAATHQPAVGSARPITVIPVLSDAVIGPAGILVEPTVSFEMLAEDAVSIAAGDTLTLNGVSYTIRAAPFFPDPYRMIARVDCGRAP